MAFSGKAMSDFRKESPMATVGLSVDMVNQVGGLKTESNSASVISSAFMMVHPCWSKSFVSAIEPPPSPAQGCQGCGRDEKANS